jgi:preprotein translocase subunit SecF
VATLHDVLVTLAFLAFFRYDFSLNVIAAILTVTGYSTNDTIVIFDRVRENLRMNRREPLNQVINRAINQTLGRTVITAGTAFLSAIALFLFGGEVLHGFAFTMLVGIITGTYSSVFIAAAIVTFWNRSKLRPAAVATTPGSVAVNAPSPARGKSKQKKTRAAS